MIDTKLIVIDGLSGSGKTTTAEWLTQQIQQQGIKIRYFSEYDTAHPLWWYEYWDGNDYVTLDYENMPIETFIATSLTKWETFTLALDGSDQPVFAESVFFQDAVAMFLMGDAAPARLKEYARDIQRIIHGLNPVLIYFRQNNPSHALQRICAVRGREFENELVENMESFPFLKRQNLKGLAGVAALWQDVHELTDFIFDEYKIRKLAIETSAGNWPDYRQQILRFLSLPSAPKPAP